VTPRGRPFSLPVATKVSPEGSLSFWLLSRFFFSGEVLPVSVFCAGHFPIRVMASSLTSRRLFLGSVPSLALSWLQFSLFFSKRFSPLLFFKLARVSFGLEATRSIWSSPLRVAASFSSEGRSLIFFEVFFF